MPRLQAALNLEAVAGDRGPGDDELACRLEVIIQAIERRDMHVAEEVADLQWRRRRLRRGEHGAGDRQRHRGQRGAVAGGVGVRRR